MPAKTERQRGFMGAELTRLRAGKKTKTGMSEKQLREFASSVDPEASPPKKHRMHEEARKYGK